MIFQYTGQPGHGKTVFALEHLLRFKKQGREVYACNVRNLDYAKAGIKPFSPEEFRDWPNQLPTGSVLLVDECYEHDMLSKRRPGSTVPEHVKQLAKHRHLGYDFIFVCQSPTKQMDEFVHDLIEEHYHVRRRYGLPFAHIRRFDKYDRTPEKSTPLTTQRKGYPKHIFKLYESTQMDTAEKRVPWFYYAAAALALFVVLFGWWTVSNVEESFTTPSNLERVKAKDGAPATAGAFTNSFSNAKQIETPEAYLARHQERFPGWHGSQPIFDGREPKAEPRMLCVMSGGSHGMQRCTCYTEQVTRLTQVPDGVCRHVALHREYDPFLAPPAPGEYLDPDDRDQEGRAAKVAGLTQDPGEVGNPSQGHVWGKKPETVRAEWSPGF